PPRIARQNRPLTPTPLPLSTGGEGLSGQTLSPRQVRRFVQRLPQGGDAALVHGLRGRPSNHRKDAKLRR
ncbi:MAG: hypothetical protein ACYC3I_18090, partial [Gemmataceae bacterium]